MLGDYSRADAARAALWIGCANERRTQKAQYTGCSGGKKSATHWAAEKPLKIVCKVLQRGRITEVKRVSAAPEAAPEWRAAEINGPSFGAARTLLVLYKPPTALEEEAEQIDEKRAEAYRWRSTTRGEDRRRWSRCRLLRGSSSREEALENRWWKPDVDLRGKTPWRVQSLLRCQWGVPGSLDSKRTPRKTCLSIERKSMQDTEALFSSPLWTA